MVKLPPKSIQLPAPKDFAFGAPSVAFQSSYSDLGFSVFYTGSIPSIQCTYGPPSPSFSC